MLGAIFEHGLTTRLAPCLACAPAAGRAARVAHAAAAGGAQKAPAGVPAQRFTELLAGVGTQQAAAPLGHADMQRRITPA